MDVKAAGDWFAANGVSFLLTAAALSFAFFILVRLMKRWSGIEESLFSNWRLGLLGATGLVLSLASGWTTWDGMRNFTKEPLLSGMITFGIQGVMLIVAWLIGESFASGMSQTSRTGGRGFARSAQAFAGSLLGLMTFAALVAVVLHFTHVIDIRAGLASGFDWSRFGDAYLVAGAALLVVLLVMVSGGDLVAPYVQSARVMIRNAVLWVMFLACMATSVFFSFDSLFSTIFPQDERARAAELRAQNQVAGVVADIGQTIAARRAEESQALFRADGWKAYEAQLAGVAEAARQSEGAIERYFNEQIEQKNRAIKEQRERIATAQTGQAGLESRKDSLALELARLKGERPGLLAEYSGKKADLDAKIKDVDAKRVEAMAEDKGVEGTGQEGKGPIWRQRMDELGKLQGAVKIGEERVRDAKKRLDAADARLSQAERELAAVDGELAKYKGEAETAAERIKLTEAAVSVDAGQQIDPARMVPAFEKAKAEFRREPSAERLAALRQVCGQIHNAMSSTEATKAKVKSLDCDPKQALEAAAALFALNGGARAFDGNCAGGDKLARHNGTDALFGFARSCLGDSGLPSRETDALRAKINLMELNRDDKAHRFVVTLNAFQDGNRLAYLALAIAVALDSLIFMSGLFGANAVRSPLSDVPRAKARGARQLEATIDAALGVRQYETAALVLSSLRPIDNTGGFSAMATLDGLDRGARDRVRHVLTAGADIGAVEPASVSPESYRVRGELREYLATVCDKHLKSDPAHERRDRLEGIIRSALKPHTKEHAEIVAHACEPMSVMEGFTSIIQPALIRDDYERRVVLRAMNAGSTLGAVWPSDKEPYFYNIRPELYEILLDIGARDAPSPAYEQERAGFSQARLGAGGSAARPIDGGDLTRRDPALAPSKTGAATRLEEPGGGAKKKGLFGRARDTKYITHQPAPAENEPEGDAIDQSVAENEPSGDVVRAFANRLKLRASQVEDLLVQAPRLFKIAEHVEKQLGTIADNDRRFRSKLQRLVGAAKRAIDQAAQELRGANRGGDGVETVSQCLERIAPLLILVEQGAYSRMLDDLIADAENDQALAFPGGYKRDWIKIAQDHIDALAPLPRSEPEDWSRVQDCLLRLSKALAELKNAETGQRPGQRLQ